ETQWRAAELHKAARGTSQTADAELRAFQTRFELARDAGDFASAKATAEQYLSIAEAHYGDAHPMYAKGLCDLAIANQSLGNYQEAEPLYLRSIAIAERQLGPEHPRLVCALNGLGSLYEAQARIKEAQSIYLRSLGIAEKALGPSHPDVAG